MAGFSDDIFSVFDASTEEPVRTTKSDETLSVQERKLQPDVK
jgi:hypothetical protein